MTVLMALMGKMIMLSHIVRHIMMVKVEESLRKKHDQKASQQPHRDTVDGMKLMPRMRQHMQQPNPEHQPRNEADRHLQPCMGQSRRQRQPATGEGGHNDEDAISRQKEGNRDGGRIVHRVTRESRSVAEVVSHIV